MSTGKVPKSAVSSARSTSRRSPGRDPPCDEVEEAAQVIKLASAVLDERAAKVRDEALRQHFLEDVPENRLTRELAQAWS